MEAVLGILFDTAVILRVHKVFASQIDEGHRGAEYSVVTSVCEWRELRVVVRDERVVVVAVVGDKEAPTPAIRMVLARGVRGEAVEEASLPTHRQHTAAREHLLSRDDECHVHDRNGPNSPYVESGNANELRAGLGGVPCSGGGANARRQAPSRVESPPGHAPAPTRALSHPSLLGRLSYGAARRQ